MNINKKNNGGFSLIELLLVIGFIAGALVLAFITYPKIQATSRANTTSQQLTVISAGIKNLYATAKNFNSLTLDVLNNAKLLPEDMATIGAPITSLSNVWGGDLVISPANGDRHYIIALTAVPKAECVKLGTGVSTNFLKLHIDAAGGAPAAGAVAGDLIFDRTIASDSVDIDPGVVTTKCGGDANTVYLTSN